MHALISQPQTRGTATSSVALAVAVLGIVLAAASWGAIGLVMAVALAVAARAAVVDARSGRIPDRLVMTATIPVAAAVVAETATGHGGAALLAVSLGAVVSGGPLLVAHLVAPAALGFGDVKLALALGSVLGLVDPRLGLVSLCVACGATATFGLAARRRTVPLGPGLVLGAIVALAVAGPLGGAPLPWR